MRQIKGKLVASVLAACLLSLAGCKPSEKTEANVSAPNVAQAAVVTDGSSLYGTQWKNGLITLTISKDGKVHSETLTGDSKTGEPLFDTDKNPCISSESDGYVDGGYIIWTDETTYEYDYLAALEDMNGPVNIIKRGQVTRPKVYCSVITYISNKTLILGEKNTYIRVP